MSLQSILKGINEIRLIEPGFNGHRKLMELYFTPSLPTKLENTGVKFTEPDTQTRNEINYLMGKTDSIDGTSSS